MFFDHLRPMSLPRAVLTLVLGVAFLSALFIPVQIPDANRLALDPRPELAVLLVAAALALLSLIGRRLAALPRRILAAAIAALAAFHLIAAIVPSFFERELDLYWDLGHLPSLIGLFVDAAGPVRGWLSIAAVAVVFAVLALAIATVLRLMERAMRGRLRAEAVLAASALGVLLALLPGPGADSLVSARLGQEVAHHAALMWKAYRVLHGAPGEYGVALAEPEPPPSDLAQLKRRDVYLVFVESYGTTVLDDEQFAPTIAPALAEFEAEARDAGYFLVSNRIVSPTFGGGSWLAHGTIASGLRLDSFLYRLLLSSGRHTLAQYMAAAGYRSLNIMPGIKSPWPEGAYWGFDRTLTAKDIGYDGPSFGWFTVPDQFTLKFALAEVDGKPHPPQFTQIVLVSSHTPFAPVPPYVADWSDAGPYKSVGKSDWDRIYADPDWWHLEAPYIESIAYDLKTLAGWLRQLKGQPLVIVLGDHQPPGFVSGSVAPHTVPIHILSRDADLVLPFASRGYVAGAIPPTRGDFEGMESFLPEFLRLFAGGHSVAAN